ncbi:MAG: bifunctional phosphopantothenoylcysteine decarboxylase/phosphopantothenate--cysteine ligase CoaBC [Synergistales bacterium]|nr:bifunctional phosphopantothenoylcysteine decarboxylase/phosphopantothenate--cysteine ligase CoaBC [Bacteroidales bacterium]MDY6396034.1 bifunctional phosphopantothenoylcysteine decarboxylase/phosphopantothenate--cysteine ligase CoaBC [Bacteroidales bacterium]MDY6434699.1 bifunctional phosphopantothenoylcysteine decarboxylase/phosphopantothenate--cysteine ligase CoaBC [Synergistales bacterium]
MIGKRILVGVSGGIAAYKIPMLVRLLTKERNEVKVVATDNALNFVSELTLQTLSKHKVYTDMFLPYEESTTEHISLSEWADVFVVAPATANIIGKYANGVADDALSTVLLAFEKKIFFAPAMNTAMYNNQAVQNNLKTLQSRGVELIEGEEGELACGSVGKGRMAEVEQIFESIDKYFSQAEDLRGKTFLVTAGPTVEQIDSVRYISNNSSGKMGYALAREILQRGGKVSLISGPVSETIEDNSNLNLVKVKSAEQMYEASMREFAKSDAAICSAAVADYTPKQVFSGKMKKKDQSLTIELEPTKDILKTLGQNKGKKIVVGFALESNDEVANAKKKLSSKNLDFIVLNSLNDKGAGFEYTTNKVTLIDKDSCVALPLKTKQEVAKDIINKIVALL